MSIRKKVVWLPYDMDTAIGINNSGLLVFSYNLEDTDLQQGGEFIFNGQDSVMWTNLRDAFGDQIKAMYQQLRSSGALSYDRVEQMFETHQAKWSEAIFNEDAFFKYIEPLTNPDAGKQPDASYLPMAQGSKAEQRKWWLYNRFRYMDSKFNAGDALTDYIMMRAYAVDDQVLTPYADIYLTTSWDGELTQVRATRGQTYTLPCPKDSANDAVVAIYSASQLSSVGDLSGLKIKSGNFSMATRLQSLKIGDNTAGYSNTNLTDLQLGNNTLLSVLDVRNCPNLTQTVDLRGCSNIEEVYFDGTSIAAAQLPNGGILRALHLPDTITNLTVMNQPSITDFVLNDASNISTLRIENCGAIDTMNMIADLAEGSRVRLIGVDWEVATTDELSDLYDILDTMKGMDEQGENMNQAQVSGTVNVQYYVGNPDTMRERYPHLTITYDDIETYTVTFMADDRTTVLQTVSGIIYGTAAQYTGETPEKTGDTQHQFNFSGWTPSVSSVTEDIICYPLFTFTGSVTRQILQGVSGSEGVTELVATGSGTLRYRALYSMKESGIKKLYFPNATRINTYFAGEMTSLEELDAPNVTYIDTYSFYKCNNLKTLNLPLLSWSGESSFSNCTSLRSVELPKLTGIGIGMFLNCTSLVEVDCPETVNIYASAFNGCSSLTTVNLPKVDDFYRQDLFKNCTSLEKIAFPSLHTWTTNAISVFMGCTALKIVDLAYVSLQSMRATTFSGCTSLIAVILRTSAVYALANINAFEGTKYATDGSGGGYIYVPSAQISGYQSATNWSTLYAAHPNMFRALENYTVDGTIDGELDETKI